MPWPGGLGGEERLEDVGQRVVVHAGAVVRHAQADPRSGRHVGAARGLGRGHGLQRRLDDQPAAVGHRVAGVDRQVHQHLLDLARVGLDRAGLADGADVELQVLADQAPQHAIELADDGVEIDDARLDDLPAREQQQLAGQGGGALAGALDLLERRPVRMRRRDLAEDDVGVALHDGEQVVEVVRDAAGEPADRLHLLRLQELLLELLALGDVDADCPRRPLRQRALAGDVRPGDGPLRAVLAGDRQLPVAELHARQRHVAAHPRPLEGVRDEAMDEADVGEHLVGGEAGDALALLVPEHEVALVVERGHQHRHVLDDRLQAAAARAQGLLGQPRVADVADDADEPRRRAVGGALDGGALVHPLHEPERRDDAMLDVVHRTRVDRPGRRGADPLVIVGVDAGVEVVDAQRQRRIDAEQLIRLGRPPLRAGGDVDVPDADDADRQRVLQVGLLIEPLLLRRDGRRHGGHGGGGRWWIGDRSVRLLRRLFDV